MSSSKKKGKHYSTRKNFLDETSWRRFPKDGIRSSLPSLVPAMCTIIGGRVEVCLRRICLWWICLDLVVVHLRSCIFRLDPSDLCYFSSAEVAVLLRWSYEALSRQLLNCLLQQSLPGSGEGGAVMAAHLWLASVLAVVARWSTNLDAIFISKWLWPF